MLSKAMTSGYWTYWPRPLLALSLLPRTGSTDAGDTFAAAVACTTCRETPLDADMLAAVQAQLGETWTVFQVWDRDQGTYPKATDVLVKADGSRWRVKSVAVKIFGNLHVCTCLKEVA